jgi:hypothetical protein
MKTKCISLLPSSHLYFTSVTLCWRPCLFILPIASLPCVLDNVQSFSLLPMGPVLGSWDVFLDETPLKLVSIFPTHPFFFLSPLHFCERFHYLPYVPRFYCFSVYQSTIDIPPPLYRCIYPNPRPTIHTLVLFTKSFSCFLCVLVISSMGTRVVLHCLFITVFLRFLVCRFYLQMAVYVISGYCESSILFFIGSVC